MGITSIIINNDLLKKSNVKLQIQQIQLFIKSAIKRHRFNNKTYIAIETAGMLRVLDDTIYVDRNKVDN